MEGLCGASCFVTSDSECGILQDFNKNYRPSVCTIDIRILVIKSCARDSGCICEGMDFKKPATVIFISQDKYFRPIHLPSLANLLLSVNLVTSAFFLSFSISSFINSLLPFLSDLLCGLGHLLCTNTADRSHPSRGVPGQCLVEYLEHSWNIQTWLEDWYRTHLI